MLIVLLMALCCVFVDVAVVANVCIFFLLSVVSFGGCVIVAYVSIVGIVVVCVAVVATDGDVVDDGVGCVDGAGVVVGAVA